jgi:predicted outer membrane lipoprotein
LQNNRIWKYSRFVFHFFTKVILNNIVLFVLLHATYSDHMRSHCTERYLMIGILLVIYLACYTSSSYIQHICLFLASFFKCYIAWIFTKHILHACSFYLLNALWFDVKNLQIFCWKFFTVNVNLPAVFRLFWKNCMTKAISKLINI